MNEVTLSVDILPALSALAGDVAALPGEPSAPAAPSPSASGLPSEEAVAAFQSAMRSLVAANREAQVALEHAAPLSLEAPVAKPIVVSEATPQVQVTPQIVREFAEAIAPLVSENREVQAALEQAAPLSLEAPEAKPIAVSEAQPDISAASVAKPVVASEAMPDVPAASVAKPIVASEATPQVQVTPQIVREFAEAIAPLVAENREVQAALEQAAPLSLEAPEAKPVAVPGATPDVPAASGAKPVVASEATPQVQVTPQIAREFAEVIAPLVTENREIQAALEQAAPLSLEAPEAKPVAVPGAMPVDPAASGAKPVVAVKDEVREADSPEAGDALPASAVVPPVQVGGTGPIDAGIAAVAGVEVTAPSPKAAPTSSEVLIAAAEAVADAIMVTPGLLSGEGQIRVQLRPDVLEGTEIVLEVSGRTIAVDFLAKTEDMQVLIQRCLPQLEQHLSSRIHSFAIGVTVNASRRRKV